MLFAGGLLLVNMDEKSMQPHVLGEFFQCIGGIIVYNLQGNPAYVALLPTGSP